MLPMSEAPRDGTRILLCFRPYLFSFRTRDFQPTPETKWEEVRWLPEGGGSPAHWNPWSGSARTRSSEHISDEDAICWLPRPDETRRK